MHKSRFHEIPRSHHWNGRCFDICCQYCHIYCVEEEVHVIFPLFTGKLKKPNLLTLMNLKTSQGDLKIIRRSAKHYHDIGILLLNDHHGDRVDVIVHDKMKANAIMLTVYKEWIDEDPKCSWDTLTECFRQCELTSLASSIEQHFELPSPKGIIHTCAAYPDQNIL